MERDDIRTAIAILLYTRGLDRRPNKQEIQELIAYLDRITPQVNDYFKNVPNPGFARSEHWHMLPYGTV